MGKVVTHRSQARGRHEAIAGVRIKLWSMGVDRNLKTAVVEIRNTIDEFTKVDPRRHPFRSEATRDFACRNAEEKDLLFGDVNQPPQQRGKDLWQPRSTGENELPGEDRSAGDGLNRLAIAAGRLT